ncbi:MAG TPA: hypothetical protein PKA90_15190 [Ignavibacteria bacterium]|nr:hypothetical protein [Ignavibacteria bacterium]HMR41763.1 hypothetical protein [Ignavibacteria bacterium]
MLKLILVIPVLIVLSLITPDRSNSQNKNFIASELTINSSDSDKNPQSTLFKLYQNEPIELNEVTIIKFDLLKEANVILNVTDGDGKIVEYLIDGEMQPGTYCVHFKSSDITVLKATSYKIEVNGISETRKIAIL